MDNFKIPVSFDVNSKKPKATDDTEENSKVLQIVCPYIEPKWSQPPSKDHEDGVYRFEVLKNGVIVEEINNLSDKAYHIFGRLPTNDFVMLHPTISRFHAVLQYRPAVPVHDEQNQADSENEKKQIEEGWYLYDLNSTHGTFLNKIKITPKTYIRVRVGYMIKLGASTRTYILQGSSEEDHVDSDLTITEMKNRHVQMIKERQQKLEHQKEEERLKKIEEDSEGISWGMAEDADEETDLSINPYATTNNEELFLDDPKKTLRGYFEREGLEVHYKLDEISPGSFVCKVELPQDDAFGRPLIAEASHKGKKKDCVIQCSLEACRILDRQGVLRQANQEPMRKKRDQSDSDDDDFLDRTGDIERKRLKKMTHHEEKVLNYEDLLQQESEVKIKIAEIEEAIRKYHEDEKLKKEEDSAPNEDLDDFMTHLSTEKKMDKIEIKKMRLEQHRLQNEYTHLLKLIKITRPASLPPLTIEHSADLPKNEKKSLPLFGKRDKCRFSFTSKNTCTQTSIEQKPTNPITQTNTDNSSPNGKLPTERTVESVVIPSPEDLSKPMAEDLVDLPKDEVREKLSDVKEEHKEPENIQSERLMKTLTETDATNSKKKRPRNRIRDKNRDNVDMNDVEEMDDDLKFSKWIPPPDQSGDGFTKLNEKYGY